jgi:hypothetical protein
MHAKGGELDEASDTEATSNKGPWVGNCHGCCLCTPAMMQIPLLALSFIIHADDVPDPGLAEASSHIHVPHTHHTTLASSGVITTSCRKYPSPGFGALLSASCR